MVIVKRLSQIRIRIPKNRQIVSDYVLLRLNSEHNLSRLILSLLEYYYKARANRGNGNSQIINNIQSVRVNYVFNKEIVKERGALITLRIPSDSTIISDFTIEEMNKEENLSALIWNLLSVYYKITIQTEYYIQQAAESVLNDYMINNIMYNNDMSYIGDTTGLDDNSQRVASNTINNEVKQKNISTKSETTKGINSENNSDKKVSAATVSDSEENKNVDANDNIDNKVKDKTSTDTLNSADNDKMQEDNKVKEEKIQKSKSTNVINKEKGKTEDNKNHSDKKTDSRPISERMSWRNVNRTVKGISEDDLF